MAKKALTLKEQLEEVNTLIEKNPSDPELIKQKAEIEVKLSKVEAMQAGKEKKESEEKVSNVITVNGQPAKDMCLAEVWKLEKHPTDQKTPDGTVIHELTEVKLLKRVKILREHLDIHAEQEANTLLRYKEVK